MMPMSHRHPHGMYPCSAAEYPMVATACLYVVPKPEEFPGRHLFCFVLVERERIPLATRARTRLFACLARCTLVKRHGHRHYA